MRDNLGGRLAFVGDDVEGSLRAISACGLDRDFSSVSEKVWVRAGVGDASLRDDQEVAFSDGGEGLEDDMILREGRILDLRHRLGWVGDYIAERAGSFSGFLIFGLLSSFGMGSFRSGFPVLSWHAELRCGFLLAPWAGFGVGYRGSTSVLGSGRHDADVLRKCSCCSRKG